MNDFNPGAGWREVPDGENVSGEVLTLTNLTDHVAWRRWVRDEPVPSLPTEPCTVIKVFKSASEESEYNPAWEIAVLWGIHWRNPATGQPVAIDRISGFEVLSEPRAATAKAVIEYVEGLQRLDTVDLHVLRNAFGVEP